MDGTPNRRNKAAGTQLGVSTRILNKATAYVCQVATQRDEIL